MSAFDAFTAIFVLDPQVSLEAQFETDQHLVPLLTNDNLILRAWPTQGVILGKLDTVLPGFSAGEAYLRSQGLPVLIRKAGGLGVVCDDGVLNLTFLVSKHHPRYGGLHASYTMAVELITAFLKPLNLAIEVKAIPQSYCPGDYDLSVGGKKFAGIAQFRSKDAVMVMATLAVCGDQEQRCRLMKGFYERANLHHDPSYPTVDPAVMSTLSALSGQAWRVETLWEHIRSVVDSRE